MREIRDQDWRARTGSRLERYHRRLTKLAEPISDLTRGMVKDALVDHGFVRLPPPSVSTGSKVLGPESRRVCLYASYNKRSKVSEMVFAQLRAYAAQGFAIAFITMSARISDEDRERLLEICWAVVKRESHGRDFGAWADAVRTLELDQVPLDELLLTNDSNLGPLFPLEPMFQRLRQADGVLGLIESQAHGSHLQSFFLLARGTTAVAATIDFLRVLKRSFSKERMIRRGELGFTQSMRERRVPLRALISYEEIEFELLADPLEQAELWAVYPWIFSNGDNTVGSLYWRGGDRFYNINSARQKYLFRLRLFAIPLNPTHQLSGLLVRKLGFPFIKTELIVKNPTSMPSVPDWRQLVGPSSPVSVEVIEQHLALC